MKMARSSKSDDDVAPFARKICVAVSRFTVSGVPLAQIRLARSLAEAGNNVDLVVGYVPPEYDMPPIEGVNVTIFGRPKVRSLAMPFARYLRTRRPNVVFVAEDHLVALVLGVAIVTRSNAKISGSSRVTPFDTYSDEPFTKRWFLKQIMRAVSWRADALTCVSQDMVEQYRSVFKGERHVCVYNIVDDAASHARMTEPLDDPWFSGRTVPVVIGAGSLVMWKGFDDLIRAFALVRARGITARLVILGEGPERATLEALVAEKSLQDCIRLLGRVENPLKYFANSDVFVLSSRVEGMPNVLVEAMMCGCTPVATDCPTGPREVIGEDRSGYLAIVGDPISIADAIEKALDRPIPPEVLREAVAPFEEKRVIERHLQVLGLTH